MARPSIVFIVLALVFVVEVSGSTNRQFYQPVGGEGSVPVAECPQKCDYRCSKANAREMCLTDCKLCCETCRCVPSGTAGNKEECPCYNNWKSKQGKPKCP
ncbi:hypothetical protein ACP70R_019754 [Stipagrostis hirtigluma subsp. patula]